MVLVMVKKKKDGDCDVPVVALQVGPKMSPYNRIPTIERDPEPSCGSGTADKDSLKATACPFSSPAGHHRVLCYVRCAQAILCAVPVLVLVVSVSQACPTWQSAHFPRRVIYHATAVIPQI